MPPKIKKFELKDFVLTFLMPTLAGKILIIYFGQNYSANPGKGYGIGLAFAIIFTASMIGRFLWKYRNFDDGDPYKG